MNATVKTPAAVNYTPEMTAKMVDMYTEQKLSVEVIADAIGKSVRSVVAKLSREKVYVAKVRTTKTGEAIVKKDTVADSIGAFLGMNENDVESLTKANKTALKLIADALLPKA
jgi:response regulator RpfG family c-di-GMP phosphodiesterase